MALTRRATCAVGAACVVVADPGGSWVEAWSSTRLPFEPSGVMRDLRDDLASAVARLSAGPTEALHALYASPVEGSFDVENVLLYEVGPAAFRRSAAPGAARFPARWRGAAHADELGHRPVDSRGDAVSQPTVDGLLAATALVHDMVLVTRNVRDVASTGVQALDPSVQPASGPP